MPMVFAFLYRHSLLGVACIVVLWPSVFVAPYLIGAPGYAVLLLLASIFVLYIVCEGSDVWPRRRGVTAILLASVVLVPYGVINMWLLGEFLESGARDRPRTRAVQSFHDRIAAEGQVEVSEVVSGWDTVCACTVDTDYPFTDCYASYGTIRRHWQLKFYRHSSGKLRTDDSFLEVPMPGLANVSLDRTICYTVDQAPVISRDPLYSDSLMLIVPSPPAWLAE